MRRTWRPRRRGPLNIYGFGPGDDVANGRAAYAENQLGNNVGVDNPRGAFNDQAFLAMLASGNVPDIVYMNRRLIGTYAARRALLPLNCIRSENVSLSQYRAAALGRGSLRGQTYALPEFTNPNPDHRGRQRRAGCQRQRQRDLDAELGAAAPGQPAG